MRKECNSLKFKINTMKNYLLGLISALGWNKRDFKFSASLGAIGYAVELLVSSKARSSSFPNGWYSDWEHKARIYTTKDLFYSLSLR